MLIIESHRDVPTKDGGNMRIRPVNHSYFYKTLMSARRVSMGAYHPQLS